MEGLSLILKRMRSETGAKPIDCKRALDEFHGDVEAALDSLKKKSSVRNSKHDRATSDGVIAIKNDGKNAVVLEFGAETDFVVRNEKFQTLASDILDIAYNNNIHDMETLKEYKYHDFTVNDGIASMINKVGENIVLRRFVVMNMEGRSGVIASYLHGTTSPNVGRIGALVMLESEGDQSELQALGEQLAMQITAMRPSAITIEDLDQVAVSEERNLILAEVKSQSQGKTQEIIDKMVEGKLAKYYQEIVLMEQNFIMDDKIKVRDVVQQRQIALGCPIKVVKYQLFVLGQD